VCPAGAGAREQLSAAPARAHPACRGKAARETPFAARLSGIPLQAAPPDQEILRAALSVHMEESGQEKQRHEREVNHSCAQQTAAAPASSGRPFSGTQHSPGKGARSPGHLHGSHKLGWPRQAPGRTGGNPAPTQLRETGERSP